MNTKLNGTVLVTTGLLIALALPISASAYGPSGTFRPVEVRVPYSDLDLDNALLAIEVCSGRCVRIDVAAPGGFAPAGQAQSGLFPRTA
jgi:hypothetical protein